MAKLVCKSNPAIVIVAPDELISEVGDNCWHMSGPQPLTYPKCLWEKIDQSPTLEGMDEELKKEIETWVPAHVRCKNDPDTRNIIIKWGGNVAKHFADWQRTNMIKQAISCNVIKSYNPLTKGPSLHGIEIIYPDQNKPHIVAGDKIKIIIIEEKDPNQQTKQDDKEA